MNHLIYIKNLFLISLLIASFNQKGQTQDYKSSIGIKLGTHISVSYSHYRSANTSIEAIAGITREANQSNYIFGGFYKIHFNVADELPTLKMYTGGGLFLILNRQYGDRKLSIAPSGIIGIEYTLEDTPVNFFIDISPYFNIRSTAGSEFNIHANLGARYVLNSFD